MEKAGGVCYWAVLSNFSLAKNRTNCIAGGVCGYIEGLGKIGIHEDGFGAEGLSQFVEG